MTEFYTIVTATIINEDGDNESYSTLVPEDIDLRAEIDSAVSEATERFKENVMAESSILRAVVNINKVPVARMPVVIVTADVPEGDAPAIVTATIEK